MLFKNASTGSTVTKYIYVFTPRFFNDFLSCISLKFTQIQCAVLV